MMYCNFPLADAGDSPGHGIFIFFFFPPDSKCPLLMASLPAAFTCHSKIIGLRSLHFSSIRQFSMGTPSEQLKLVLCLYLSGLPSGFNFSYGRKIYFEAFLKGKKTQHK